LREFDRNDAASIRSVDSSTQVLGVFLYLDALKSPLAEVSRKYSETKLRSFGQLNKELLNSATYSDLPVSASIKGAAMALKRRLLALTFLATALIRISMAVVRARSNIMFRDAM
jgi:hypothetical protein